MSLAANGHCPSWECLGSPNCGRSAIFTSANRVRRGLRRQSPLQRLIGLKTATLLVQCHLRTAEVATYGCRKEILR